MKSFKLFGFTFLAKKDFDLKTIFKPSKPLYCLCTNVFGNYSIFTIEYLYYPSLKYVTKVRLAISIAGEYNSSSFSLRGANGIIKISDDLNYFKKLVKKQELLT